MYQNRHLLTTRDILFKPRLHSISWVNSFSTEMIPWKASRAFKVLDDVSVTPGVADLRDTEKPDQFFFCHDGRAEAEM